MRLKAYYFIGDWQRVSYININDFVYTSNPYCINWIKNPFYCRDLIYVSKFPPRQRRYIVDLCCALRLGYCISVR